MNKRLLIFFTLLLLTISELTHAGNRFVSATGGADTTCPSGTPCSMAVLNSTARPGDNVFLADGTYATAPNPTNNASQGSPITFMPTATSPVAANVILPAMKDANVIRDSWLKFKYVKFNGVVHIWPTWAQSDADTTPIRGTQMDGVLMNALFIANHSDGVWDSCVVDTFTGGSRPYNYFKIWNQGNEDPFSCCSPDVVPQRTSGNVWTNNTIRLNSGNQTEPGGGNAFHYFEWGNNASLSKTDVQMLHHNRFERNKVTVTVNAYNSAIGNSRAVYWVASGGFDSLKFNHWTITDNTPTSYGGQGSTRAQCFRFRDRANYMVFYGDTILIRGRLGGCMLSSQGGSNQGKGNEWNHCYFDWAAAYSYNGNAGIEFDYGFWDTKFINNIVKVKNHHGISAYQVKGNYNDISHNTFYLTHGKYGIRLRMDDGFSVWEPNASVNMTNNIVYVGTNPATQVPAFQVHPITGRNFTSNNNLAYSRDNNGSRTVEFKLCSTTGSSGCGSVATQYSRFGTDGTWYQNTGQDGDSKFGSPKFRDSTDVTTDVRLSSTGAALFGPDFYVGAFPYQRLKTLVMGDSTGGLWNFTLVNIDPGQELAWTRIFPNPKGATGPAWGSPPESISTSFANINLTSADEIWLGTANPYPSPAFVDTVGKVIDAVVCSYVVSLEDILAPTNYGYSTIGCGDNVYLVDPPWTSDLTRRITPHVNKAHAGTRNWVWTDIGTDSNIEPSLKVQRIFEVDPTVIGYYTARLHEWTIDIYGSPAW